MQDLTILYSKTIRDILLLHFIEEYVHRRENGIPVGAAEQGLYVGMDVENALEVSMVGYEENPTPLKIYRPRGLHEVRQQLGSPCSLDLSPL